MLDDLLGLLRYDAAISGEWLARELGISRAAINKRIQQLRARGVLISASSEGYRFEYPYHWWSQTAFTNNGDVSINILNETESTSDEARRQSSGLQLNRPQAYLTDFQTQGRGRRGNGWSSFPGRQLTFTYAELRAEAPAQWQGLSLAIGVVIAEVLKQHAIEIRLKWPNDLLLADAKLGGLLIEMDAQAEGPTALFIGLGINEFIKADEAEMIAQPVIGLQSAQQHYQRQQLLMDLLRAIRACVDGFPVNGLAAYLERWKYFDDLYGKSIDYEKNGVALDGIAMGINSHGALLVEKNGMIERCYSYEAARVRK